MVPGMALPDRHSSKGLSIVLPNMMRGESKKLNAIYLLFFQREKTLSYCCGYSEPFAAVTSSCKPPTSVFVKGTDWL